LTDDGRPVVREQGELDDELALWMPEPPRDGDPVYCCGVRVGTVHGDLTRPGEGCVETVPTRELPPKLAAHTRAKAAQGGAPRPAAG
jgi:hypothetical protein